MNFEGADMRISLVVARLAAFLVVFAAAGCGGGAKPRSETPRHAGAVRAELVRVMSFNVAHDKDGYWAWELSYDLRDQDWESLQVGSVPGNAAQIGHKLLRISQTRASLFVFSKRAWNVHLAIQKMSPDVLGLQEALWEQAKIMAHALGYNHYARGREEDIHFGETNAILWNPSRVTAQTQGTISVGRQSIPLPAMGTFWYSKHPDNPGSMPEDDAAWGKPSMRRICSWVEFKTNSGGKGFYHFNTHLQHKGGAENPERNRMKQVELLIDRVAARRNTKLPIIVTGDFNAKPGDEPVKQLTGSVSFEGATWTNPSPLVDTFAQNPTTNGGGTVFDEDGNITGRRIDYVFASKQFAVIQAGIQHNPPGPGSTSDHLAVFATLSFPP